MKVPTPAVLSPLFFLLTFSAVPSSGATQKPIILPKLSPSNPQGVEGGFWKTDNYFDPVLHLKNILLKQPLDVVPSLYFADGTEYDLPTIHLEAAGVAAVGIRTAIQDVPAALQSHVSTYGMIGVRYNWSWPAIIATIQNTDEIASLTIESSARVNAP